MKNRVGSIIRQLQKIFIVLFPINTTNYKKLVNYETALSAIDINHEWD